MKMHRMARRGRGRRFGHPHGHPMGGGMIRGFLEENPDVVERLARYGATQLRADGWSDDEIREHLERLQERGLLTDVDIESILD